MSTRKHSGRGQAIALLGLAILLAALPMALAPGAAFPGSDEAAVAAIGELEPGYTPWAAPPIAPPGAAAEGLLFTLQAAMGAGVIGYYFGLKRGLRQAVGRDDGSAAAPEPRAER